VTNLSEAERIAHLDCMPMPGGVKAIREPWSMAAVYLQRTFADEFAKLSLPFVAKMDTTSWLTLKRMIATKTNFPETSSMGRLFDTVSSLLCLRYTTNYEVRPPLSWPKLPKVIVSRDMSLTFPMMGVSYAPRMLFAWP
jgi:hydrogenase maturation protein HypF